LPHLVESLWLKSIKGRGVATELIRRLTKETRQLSVKLLYLCAPSAEVLHANLGWVRLDAISR